MTQWGYDTFGATTIYSLTINERNFLNSSRIVIGAKNIEQTTLNGVTTLSSGAYSSVSVSVVPAYTIQGTAYVNDKVAANQELLLATSNFNYYIYTNSTGYFRFFAQPGVNYTLQTPTSSVGAVPIDIGATDTGGNTYNVYLTSLSFSESGLGGNEWSATIAGNNGDQTIYTEGQTITFDLIGNQGYSYSVSSSGFQATPSSGYVNMGTTPITVDISFVGIYSATFSESGLPSGLTWYAYMGNKQGSASSGSSIKLTHSSSLTFSIPSVSVREPNGDTYTYSPSPSSGTATDGGTVGISFHLSEICYGRICTTESINGTTPVLLANGTYELAENITAGTSVEAYNTNSGSFQNATVREVIIDTHSRMVVVNGYLDVSYNQSVLTNHGYVTAGSLTVGDRVFDAFTGHYIRVRSVELEKGNFTMYDFVLGGINDYIAWQYVLEAGS